MKQSVMALASALLMAAIATQPATAESSCKGLDNSPCDSKAQCHWVNGYTRKDGVKVSGHCRKSASRKGAKSEPSSRSSSQKDSS
ncbi:hypothetical protein [Thiorhodococcus minor]|uniref:DUF2282 domain-containing protein n=1 Tax=Thiorhodococcus minor TaxID=57489 RepID=A0A6M0K2P7_9GAMM|nr:hypothetical protein [Thiorhodococcus minor]NEV63574.1 hypothetical protein [Thiorhodococcus minor]